MLITLLLTDGSQQVVDVTEIRMSLDGNPLELSFRASPTRLRIYSPGTEERWQRLVIHPDAANALSLEIRAQESKPNDVADR
jgi:hypothetical protein